MTLEKTRPQTPRTGVPVTHPQHWSHFRRAETDAELAELAAATFTPDVTLEQAAYIRAKHPDVFNAMPAEQAAVLDGYLAKRKLVLDGGRTVAGLAPTVTAAIDAAAAEYQATNAIPLDVRNVDDVHRGRFAEVANVDGLGARTLAAWREWQEASREAQRFMIRRHEARGALGLQTGYPMATARSILREWANAVGDDGAFDR